MGAAKKHPLDEVFADYDRSRFEYLIRDAAAISQGDPEIVKTMEEMLADPVNYLKRHSNRLEERGIELLDRQLSKYCEPGDLLELSLIDELGERFYVIELDSNIDIDDFFEALEEVETYDLIADAMPGIKDKIDPDDDMKAWIHAINELLGDKGHIVHLDVNTDSFPVCVVTVKAHEILMADNENDADDEGNEDNNNNRQAVRNVIDDRDLKMRLADTALGLLVQGEDYGGLANTRCEFGYLYYFEDHGIEALFKLETDKTAAYFAAQGDKLMRLNFNEELFRSTIERFLELHGNGENDNDKSAE